MRINKYISETGYCSRRETVRLIQAGRITVNGELCKPDHDVNPGDFVLIDGKPIPSKEEPIYMALNKPRGITCTAAEHIEGNITQFVNHPRRIFPVGRLDKDSEGLILLTNDGDIVNEILRSEHSHEKEYLVKVDKPFSDTFLKGMSGGVDILVGKTEPCSVKRISDDEFRIILTQGLNRQIRRMCRVFGYTAVRLQRVRIMNVKLDGLDVGQWRDLAKEELSELKALLSRE